MHIVYVCAEVGGVHVVCGGGGAGVRLAAKISKPLSHQ